VNSTVNALNHKEENMQIQNFERLTTAKLSALEMAGEFINDLNMYLCTTLFTYVTDKYIRMI
jgi:hypothetical protein